jgi:hypothetical protein
VARPTCAGASRGPRWNPGASLYVRHRLSLSHTLSLCLSLSHALFLSQTSLRFTQGCPRPPPIHHIRQQRRPRPRAASVHVGRPRPVL